jgi:hypothetical protein
VPRENTIKQEFKGYSPVFAQSHQNVSRGHNRSRHDRTKRLSIGWQSRGPFKFEMVGGAIERRLN